MHAVTTIPSVAQPYLFLTISSASTMIPYRGIIAALGTATHDNVPKVVIISQEDSGKEPRDIHQEVPWEASNSFSRDVIEKAELKLIPFDQSRLRREIKETARC